LNHQDLKDRKEKMLVHLVAAQLDSVMDREEVGSIVEAEPIS
jgi:hypothetical protein